MTAALAAAQSGAAVLLLEKERRPGGNTALSSGMIPAAGTRLQLQAGIDDTPERMARDILAKNHNSSDPAMTLRVCRESAPLVDWLAEQVGVPIQVVTDFNYPGHAHHRMHAHPQRTGAALAEELWKAICRDDCIEAVCSAPVRGLVAGESGEVAGVTVERSEIEHVRARKVILASSGFGADRQMVERYCPEIVDAIYFGTAGNTGEGIRWGMELGAAVQHMDAYQGHGSVAHPHGILLTWIVMAQGGFLVNRGGVRFGDESEGYSSYAVHVLRQPGGVAYEIFDQPILDAVRDFPDFKMCVEAGAVRSAGSTEALAEILGIDAAGLLHTLNEYNEIAAGRSKDAFRRADIARPLHPPFYGVQVTGALFHTQGGLKVDPQARVLRSDGTILPNLYAGGGTAVGVSGQGAQGYLAGNGLLAALVLGRIAGLDAAASL